MSRLTLDGLKISWASETFQAYLEDRVAGDIVIDLKLSGKVVPDWAILVLSDTQGGPLAYELGPDNQTVIVKLRSGTKFSEGETLTVFYWRLEK